MITSITDIRKLESKVSDCAFYNTRYFFFRGHENKSYTLKPTISRKLNDLSKIQVAEEYIAEKILEFEKSQEIITEIRTLPALKGYLNKWRILFQAQHIGIPTRLIDTTISIYHAVFFSVMNPKFDLFDGELIIFYCHRNLLYTDVPENNDYFFGDIDPYNVSSQIFINGGNYIDNIQLGVLSEVRRYKQFGRFLIQPAKFLLMPVKSNSSIIIETERIPKENKENIRKELNDLNINIDSVLLRDPDSTVMIKREIELYIENLNTA